MLQDTDNVEIALGDLSITNRLYRKIEPYCLLLPIRSYRDFAETVAYVNLRPRPLAAHDFDRDRAEQVLNLERRHLILDAATARSMTGSIFRVISSRLCSAG